MLQKPPGERVKTAKDAIHLARLLRLDQLFATTAALLMTIVLVAGLLMRQPRGLGRIGRRHPGAGLRRNRARASGLTAPSDGLGPIDARSSLPTVPQSFPQ